jgi:hypothetical protein
MERVQLTHPEGKKGTTMDKAKYEALKTSFLTCLKQKKVAPFQELLKEVEKDLKKRKVKIEGKLEWNLFWVTLDLVSKKAIKKDRTSSPIKYSLSK